MGEEKRTLSTAGAEGRRRKQALDPENLAAAIFRAARKLSEQRQCTSDVLSLLHRKPGEYSRPRLACWCDASCFCFDLYFFCSVAVAPSRASKHDKNPDLVAGDVTRFEQADEGFIKIYSKVSKCHTHATNEKYSIDYSNHKPDSA